MVESLLLVRSETQDNASSKKTTKKPIKPPIQKHQAETVSLACGVLFCAVWLFPVADQSHAQDKQLLVFQSTKCKQPLHNTAHLRV